MKKPDIKEIIANYDNKTLSDRLVSIAKRQNVDYVKVMLEESAKRLEQQAQ